MKPAALIRGFCLSIVSSFLFLLSSFWPIAAPAQGIVYSGFQLVPLGGPLDLDGDGIEELTFNVTNTPLSGPFVFGTGQFIQYWASNSAAINLTVNGTGLQFLDTSAQIGATNDWSSSLDTWDVLTLSNAFAFSQTSYGPLAQFENNRAYLGFQWQKDDGTHYGWIFLASGVVIPPDSPPGSPFFDGTFAVDWAYESAPDVPITPGAVPEPSISALFLIGTLFLLGSRRYNFLKRGLTLAS